MDRRMRALGRIGAAGAAAGSVEERLAEALAALHTVIPFAAVHVEARVPARAARTSSVGSAGTAQRPGQAGTWSTCVSHGYPPAVIDWLRGPGVQHDIEVTGGHRHRRPVRWRDVGADPLELRTIGEYLHPHGYREGASAALYTGDDRWTGCLHLSLDDAHHPDDTEVELLQASLSTFAGLCREAGAQQADGGNVHVLRRGDDGRITTPDGRSPNLPVQVLAASSAMANGQTRLVHAETRWWRIRVLPTGPAARSGPVWVEPDPDRRGLTDREVEVLGAVCEGWSNNSIAERFGVTSRTIATHVERILVKLDAPNRAGAAAIASEEGLRCRPVGV